MKVFIFMLLLLACTPPAARAAGFDCSKASAPADLVICSDPALLDRNNELQEAWSSARRAIDSAWHEALLADQRNWITGLAKECDLPSRGKPEDKVLGAAESCLGDRIDRRKEALLTLAKLKGKLSQAVTPERTREALATVICDDDGPRLVVGGEGDAEPPTDLQACLEKDLARDMDGAADEPSQDSETDNSFAHPYLPTLVSSEDESVCGPFMEAVSRDYAASHKWEQMFGVTGQLSGTLFGTSLIPDDGTMFTLTRDQAYSVRLPGAKGRQMLFLVFDWNHNVHESYGLFLSNRVMSKEEVEQISHSFDAGQKEAAGIELFSQDFYGWQRSSPVFRGVWIHGDLYVFRDRAYESSENKQDSFGKGQFGLFKVGADGKQKPTCIAAMDEKAVLAAPPRSGDQAAVLSHFKELLTVLTKIDGDGGTGCGGSGTPYVWNRHGEAVDFAIRMALARPWELLKDSGADGDSMEGNYRIDIAFLRKWGFHTLYNFKVIEHLNQLLPETLTELSVYYERQFKLPSEKATAVAQSVIRHLIDAEVDIGSNVADPLSDEEFVQDYEQKIADRGITADMLHRAILQGHRDLIQKTPDDFVRMVDKQADSPDDASVEPLLFYALGDKEMTQILISKGVGLDGTNWFGKSALMYAAQWNSPDILSLLLQNKANPNLYTETRGDSFCWAGPQVTHRSALTYAAENASYGVIDALLAAGADSHVQTQPNALGVDTFLARNQHLTDAERSALLRRLAQ